MASKVWFAAIENHADEDALCRRTREVFHAAGLDAAVPEDGITAVKTHFGERGNNSFVPPSCVRTVVDEVRKAGGRPCLVETSTLYRGQRHNAVDHFSLAVEHGFGPEAMGCPLVFLDGLRGNLHVERPVDLKHCKTVAVAGDFTLMPAAVVVTHFTGHVLAGVGGAIKNVAMGLSSRPGKLRQHSQGNPKIKKSACIACGTCAEWCPEDAITVGKAAVIDHKRCIGCGECLAVCRFDAVQYNWGTGSADLQRGVAEHALGAVADKRDKCLFVNLLCDMTRDCDCMNRAQDPLLPDVGIAASLDPVAVDQATLDLTRESAGASLAEKARPGVDASVQLEHAEEIGLGSRSYELIRLPD